MTQFAKVINNKVVNVIVAEQEHIDTLSDREFYIKDDGTKFNKAGIGFAYDAVRNAFIPPKPYPSWTLNETTCLWDAPVAYPDDDKRYDWNELTKNWDNIDG